MLLSLQRSERSFWILDECRDSHGLRTKFKRNLRGTTHRSASQLTRGQNAKRESALMEAEVGKDFGKQGLINDLKKYQRRATMILGEEFEVKAEGEGIKMVEGDAGGAEAAKDGDKEKAQYVFKDCYLVSTVTRTLGNLEIKREGKKEAINFVRSESDEVEEGVVRGEGISWAWVTEPLETQSFDVKR